ncbi:MAG: hypothetical protein OXF66_07620 [Gammaproteobacteria bacterium]|nr:hypothetical protein [Gammaproteobacteria bacterium]
MGNAVKERGCNVLAMDSLEKFGNGFDLDKTGEATEVMTMLDKLTSKLSVAMLFIHHHNKQGEFSGNHRINADVKASIDCQLKSGDLTITGRGRRRAGIDKTAFTYDPETCRLEVDQTVRNETQDAIMALWREDNMDERKSQNQIRKAVGKNFETVRAALHELVKSKLLNQFKGDRNATMYAPVKPR